MQRVQGRGGGRHVLLICNDAASLLHLHGRLLLVGFNIAKPSSLSLFVYSRVCVFSSRSVCVCVSKCLIFFSKGA